MNFDSLHLSKEEEGKARLMLPEPLPVTMDPSLSDSLITAEPAFKEYMLGDVCPGMVLLASAEALSRTGSGERAST